MRSIIKKQQQQERKEHEEEDSGKTEQHQMEKDITNISQGGVCVCVCVCVCVLICVCVCVLRCPKVRDRLGLHNTIYV